MAVRYDRKTNEAINRLVRNYNAKIRRVKATGKDVYIPEKISASDITNLKKSVANRQDLKRRLKDIEYYTARGGEKFTTYQGSKIGQAQKKSLVSYKKLASRRLNQKLKFYETETPTSSGRKEAGTFEYLRTDEYLNTVAKKNALLNKDISGMTISEINEYIEKLKSNTRTFTAKDWQRSYVQDIFKSVGITYGVDSKQIDDIADKLANVTPAQFDKLTRSEALFKAIQNLYEAVKDKGFRMTEKMEQNAGAIFEKLDENVDELITKVIAET